MERGISLAISRFGEAYRDRYRPPAMVRNVLDSIRDCRTEQMGGKMVVCSNCGARHVEYNSCRDRHCPNCQSYRREVWLHDRREELLPVSYFHVVFTLPSALDHIMLTHKKEGYGCLFRASWETLSAFGKKAGVRLGMTAVLHTWGSALAFHPHLHCIVPGGGADAGTGRWRMLPLVKGDKDSSPFLFPVKAMSDMFRAKFMACLSKVVTIPGNIRAQCFRTPWVVFTRPSATGDETVMQYLARYAYRVAIGNSRIKDVTDSGVTFSYKDYAHDGAIREMTLDGVEFMHRYAQHILPDHFVRIRHFGILAPGNRETLARLQKECGTVPVRKRRRRISWAAICVEKGWTTGVCKCCGAHDAHVVLPIEPRPRAPAGVGRRSA